MEEIVELITTDSISTDGLEDLLNVETIDREIDGPDKSSDGINHGHDYWTVEEASRNLSVSQRTIFRRLKKGTLTGFKIDGPFGEEWRIKPIDQDHDKRHEGSRPCSDIGLDSKIKENETRDSKNESEIDFLRDLVKNQSSQLEAASNVIVYMKNQLETKDNQIKLLTDSQHESGLWSRFTKWFLGQ